MDLVAVLVAVVVDVEMSAVGTTDVEEDEVDDAFDFFRILLLIRDAACLCATGRGLGVFSLAAAGDVDAEEAMEVLRGLESAILESNIGAGDCKRKYSSSSSPASDNSTSLLTVHSRIAQKIRKILNDLINKKLHSVTE